MAENNLPPDFVNRMEKVPAPYMSEQYGYSKDGLSCAMVAWMLDINVRATIKKREFQRTYQRMCLYIKHMERIMDQSNIKYDAYTGTEDGRRIKTARDTFKPQTKARFIPTAPYPITAPISSDGELCRSVSDAQTFEYKLHQLEILRYMERVDGSALADFETSTRKPRPETG
ncbi:unnamed protein product [Penicillium nalgiovense]|uniref:Uncharacterized protein n=1 Tax=Penicillium nalgiovense TaxID=60175 RepID=A0A1V6XNV8_PENNA|nr:hypothetical protein PENNAL_c0064G06452 [Penicillium nalgiovense]CAG7934905.1 unnamed protein product [Penicillium nalgiovense]CAG7951822.1 unnamed protein product [Penicillium nalgiovense]CAG7955600.1 unnamed protein product [Penicillium nalgiovense]CAG7956283.1 unnamed protein product [Penicillium nalgiovense]